MALSIQQADEATPQPTYLIPDNSKRPCIVPSSPFLPCRTGHIKSTFIFFPSSDIRPSDDEAGGRTTFLLSFLFSQLPSAISSVSASVTSHPPPVKLYRRRLCYIYLYLFLLKSRRLNFSTPDFLRIVLPIKSKSSIYPCFPCFLRFLTSAARYSI